MPTDRPLSSPGDIVRFLKTRVPLFADFSDERLGELVRGSRVASFEPNEAILHHGAEATLLGVVLSGAVSASAFGEGGVRQTLGRLEAGGTFGELALMTGDRMLADLIAESRSQVLCIPVSLFQSVIVAEPAAVQQISRTIADRFKEVTANPAAAAAALRQSADPYGLSLRGERPEKILVINCGSSSLKYSFYDTADESRQARGQVERIGIEGTLHVHRGPSGEVRRELPRAGFAEAFRAMVEALTTTEARVIAGAGEVSRRGSPRRARRRAVHRGDARHG